MSGLVPWQVGSEEDEVTTPRDVAQLMYACGLFGYAPVALLRHVAAELAAGRLAGELEAGDMAKLLLGLARLR